MASEIQLRGHSRVSGEVDHEATARISWTEPIGSAYFSLPSEKTTSCCEVVSDMSPREFGVPE
jgi:hypothetical protein